MGDFQVSSPGEQRSGQRSRGRRTDLPNVRLLLWVVVGAALGLSRSTQTLCSLQGRSVGRGGLGGGQQVTQALSLDQGPFLGWKSRVRRANVLLSPEEFPGLPSGRRASISLPLLVPASSRLERPGATETPGPSVIRAGRK